MIPSAVRTGHPTCIRRGNRYFTRLSANFYNLILRQAYNSFESDQNSSPKNVLSGQRLGLPPLMIYSPVRFIRRALYAVSVSRSFGCVPSTLAFELIYRPKHRAASFRSAYDCHGTLLDLQRRHGC
jgi:hypothetical protein